MPGRPYAYVNFMPGREPSEQDMSAALLPDRDGRWGLPNYSISALSIFLNAQCQVLPKVCIASETSSVESLVSGRPELRDKLLVAKFRAVAPGVPARSVPRPTLATAFS